MLFCKRIYSLGFWVFLNLRNSVVVVKQTESLDVRSLGTVNATERTQERLAKKNIYLQACLRS